MKKAFKTVILLLILSILSDACFFFFGDINFPLFPAKVVKFSDLEIGENFYGSLDGHYKKLPNNYGLSVDLGSKTFLFRVPDEYVDVKFSSSFCYDNIVVEGHFIKGFYTSDYLALCEERDNGDLVYLTFDFHNKKFKYHFEVSEMCKLLNVDSISWFPLCNTNKQIRDRK